MALSFRDYLDSKAALDERSLNGAVRTAFLGSLRDRERLDCLDLGTGSGASLARLFDAEAGASMAITAVDRDPALVELAFKRTAVLLRARGFEVAIPEDGRLHAQRGGRRIKLECRVADLVGFDPPGYAGRFDAVIAHQLMDLLPVAVMAERIAGWLRPGGVFYATLNYDGGTALFPGYRDAALEGRILAAYDESMERRRVHGHPSGGAHSGRRLYDALLRVGLEPVAYGASDWSLSPIRRAYRDRDRLCLAALLEMIRDQAAASGAVADPALDGWYRHRLGELESGTLGLIVHQLDLLVEKPLAPPA